MNNNKYNQLSLEERERIAILKASGRSLRSIGKELGRDHSSISRELSRNKTSNSRYIPCKADQISLTRKQLAGRRPRLKDPFIQRYVRHLLALKYSPELISGRLQLKFPQYSISHEAIYQFIYAEAPNLISGLIRAHKKRRKKRAGRRAKKSLIPNRVSILERPEIINSREEFGHWEVDTVVSKQSKSVLQVMTERKSRYVKITCLTRNTANLNQLAIKLKLNEFPAKSKLSFTYDNGSENTKHEKVNAWFGSKSYFCQPYHSWEKGAVENINGMIRWFFPKKTDFKKVKEHQIANLEFWLNNRPKKCLGFKSPAEVFYELSGALLP